MMKIAFVITSMPVGGAEVLLVNLMRRMDRSRFAPEVICLKEPGPLGEEIAQEFPLHSGWLKSKFDLRILPKLANYFRRNNLDAVVTVGAGDKMFWGRLAAYWAGVPVIASALHSTGWPDGVGRMNRWLTPITDAFIAVAKTHGEFLTSFEKFPAHKVQVIPNGIDTQRFVPDASMRTEVRNELGIPLDANLVGIVAALRSEKNHTLFVEMAHQVLQSSPNTHFLIVGDGPERPAIEAQVERLGLGNCVHLLGVRSDTPRLLAALDLFALTSHNEANPVSILEALSTRVAVVATRVGSVAEMVREGETGLLVAPGNVEEFSQAVVRLLQDRSLLAQMGANGRQRVEDNGSLDSMVDGYQQMLTQIHSSKVVSKRQRSLLNPESPLSPTCQWKPRRPSFWR